ncbi:MAG: DNA polymerase III subunit delta [Defluviitaleaceae bacterium]|nr:DNA polymerase III subunit delta [Defluviitaleaceae bacterium]
MKELNNHIKNKSFAQAYLFFGEEPYLTSHWRRSLVSAVLAEDARDMNMEVFDGKIPAAAIMDAAETLPFLAEHRLVVVTGSGLFATGRSEDATALADFIKDIPDSTIMLFVEAEVDKRGRLYKRIAEHGLAMEAKTPREADLADWAVKFCGARGKKMARSTAMHLLRTVSGDMQLLYNEMEKLVAHAGVDAEITAAHVDTLCTKSLEAKIFDLMKAICDRDAARSFALYGNLIALKESPLMVLSMIARQFRYSLQCAALAPNMNQKDIASKLALHPFAVQEFVATGRNFPQKAMIDALEACLETDYAIKSGGIGDVLGVEVLIMRCCTDFGA